VKRAEKQVLKAGLVNYMTSEVRRQERCLGYLRTAMHAQRHPVPSRRPASLTDWHGYHGLAQTQVLIIRRARLALEAAELWNQMRTQCLVISSPKLTEGGRRVNENDPRWSAVTDDSIVEWDDGDGHKSQERWGDLMLTDRKTVEMAPDGRLVGGYPF
jgi:hypothetical protein